MNYVKACGEVTASAKDERSVEVEIARNAVNCVAPRRKHVMCEIELVVALPAVGSEKGLRRDKLQPSVATVGKGMK